MAYFLKKSRNKKGLYLQIYESHWDRGRGHTVQTSVKALGYERELRESGIADPVAHFKAEIDGMNAKRKADKAEAKTRRISDSTPELMLGHFPLRAVNEALGVERDLSFLQMAGGFRFSLYGLLSDLAYARAVAPCSKLKTYTEALPQLSGANASYSLDQLYDGVAFLGEEYRKVVEIYNAQVAEVFGRDTSTTYFDCTNFFFEVDLEGGLRRKGPSKESRHDPIVGMGLLLDAECIPLGLAVYPGNESEKPVMREVIGQVKRRNNMTGRTVRVADKGLNCADNVADAILEGDGYIFSKSVKQLPEPEQSWALSEDGWTDVVGEDGALRYRLKSCEGEFEYRVTARSGRKKPVKLEEKRVVAYNPKLARKQRAEIDRQVEKARRLRLSQAGRSEYGDCAKYVAFTAVDANGEEPDAKVVAALNHEAIEKARRLAGYNMIVTSEKAMPDEEVYSTYHELWRIEETFKAMKSQLDARPAFMQKDESITGHFLICYISVLLERLLQVKVLGNRFCTEEVMGFARGFRAVEVSERKYVNISKASSLIDELERMTGLPLGNYHLTKGQIDAITECSFKLPAAR